MRAAGLLLATEVDAEIGIPSALCFLAGRPALIHAVSSLLGCRAIDHVVVVAPSSAAAEVRAILARAGYAGDGSSGVHAVAVADGAGRHASLHSGLSCVDGPHETIVVHEISRPLVPAAVVARVVDAVAGGAEMAVPATEMTETVKEIDADRRVLRTVPRETLVRLQGPTAVRAELLIAAHAACSPADPAALAPPGTGLSIVDGSELGFAVRGAAGRGLAEALLARAEQVLGQ
jgi:2-C-methyl-D-erythritol 4-phosphate cytidylyltransferase